MSSKIFSTSFALDPTIAESYPHLQVVYRDAERETKINSKGSAVSICWTKRSALFVSAIDLRAIRFGGETLLADFEKFNSENVGLLGHDWSEHRTCEITLSRDGDNGPYKFTTAFTAQQTTWSDLASRVWNGDPISPDDS